MVIDHQNIDKISPEDFKKLDNFHLTNCIIDTIDLVGVFEFRVNLVIENCIVNKLRIHSCWFVNGLIFRNNIVKSDVDYQMGEHNDMPIVMEGNIFIGFVNFFDCQFEKVIELRNNVFEKGTNLLGNKGEGFENSFANGWHVENNVGNVDLNGI